MATRAVAGEIDPRTIDEGAIEAELQTAGLPALDLLVRTSGEVRLSNFLLWQAAYAELLFVDTLWPDFDEAAFMDALAKYAGRQRRFGGRGANCSSAASPPPYSSSQHCGGLGLATTISPSSS